jgi:Putative zinc-finger
MERAPLRPVPARPAGPVDPAAAVREVSAALPALEPLEVRALALVALADRPRAEVAGLLDIEEEELGVLLAADRKELRQTLSPLSGSGWCERAEGLISDRLDGAVGERDGRRLDVHLRNCPRCVEHERRLVQATDALVAGVAPAPAPPAIVPAESTAKPELAAIQPAAPAPVAAPDAAPARRPSRELASAIGWNVLLVVAIVLALAALALALAGALGAQF